MQHSFTAQLIQADWAVVFPCWTLNMLLSRNGMSTWWLRQKGLLVAKFPVDFEILRMMIELCSYWALC